MWEVIQTSKKTAEAGRHVFIDKKAVLSLSKRISDGGIRVPSWNRYYHFSGSPEDIVAYTLVLDSLNFCFWPGQGEKKWRIKYDSKTVSGYYAMAASLKRAIESGVGIIEAEYLMNLSLDSLKEILRGEGHLQLMEERVRILNQLGGLLAEEFNGKACKLVERARGSAIDLTRLLGNRLSSFRDIAEYNGEDVFFYKRAQIFAADLYGALDGEKWGNFIDIDKLTAFADYKLPQVLRRLGVLRYESSLAYAVDRQRPILSGSLQEVEIRANTIWAVEMIKQELYRMGKFLHAFEIDWLLWNLGQKANFKKRPYHKTLTVFY